MLVTRLHVYTKSATTCAATPAVATSLSPCHCETQRFERRIDEQAASSTAENAVIACQTAP